MNQLSYAMNTNHFRNFVSMFESLLTSLGTGAK